MEENLGWSRGKAKAGIDALDRQHTIGRYRSSIVTGESVLPFSFLLSLSHEAFFYSSFFLRMMFLFGKHFFYNCSVRNRTAVVSRVTKHLGLLSIRKNERSKTKQKTSQGLHGHSWIRIQYYACAPRGRGRSNETLPRLAPGQ